MLSIRESYTARAISIVTNQGADCVSIRVAAARRSGNLTALSSAVNASKAEAIAKNIMYAKQADLDIQNLFANLYNATQDAATCCGWSYNTTY